MDKHTTNQKNAPLGVATSAPLPKSCLSCTHFSAAFDEPHCLLFEVEIDDVSVICEDYEKFVPTEDLPF